MLEVVKDEEMRRNHDDTESDVVLHGREEARTISGPSSEVSLAISWRVACMK